MLEGMRGEDRAEGERERAIEDVLALRPVCQLDTLAERGLSLPYPALPLLPPLFVPPSPSPTYPTCTLCLCHVGWCRSWLRVW